MKTTTILSAILLSFLIACDNETVPNSFSLGLESDFKIDGEYHSTDNSLNFEISEIKDSRCPSDVVCVWAGKADVKIDLKRPVRGLIMLDTYNHAIDTIGNYSFELIDVSPYPVSTITIKLEDYKVTLKIIELKE